MIVVRPDAAAGRGAMADHPEFFLRRMVRLAAPSGDDARPAGRYVRTPRSRSHRPHRSRSVCCSAYAGQIGTRAMHPVPVSAKATAGQRGAVEPVGVEMISPSERWVFTNRP